MSYAAERGAECSGGRIARQGAAGAAASSPPGAAPSSPLGETWAAVRNTAPRLTCTTNWRSQTVLANAAPVAEEQPAADSASPARGKNGRGPPMRGPARRERPQQPLRKRDRAGVEEDRQDEAGAEHKEPQRHQHRGALRELDVPPRRRPSEHAQRDDPEHPDGDAVDDALDDDGGE